jgi:protein TonB
MDSMIVSPTTPKDSRGETVYEQQGEGEKSIPLVSGVYLSPVPIKIPIPKYPKSLRRTFSDKDVKLSAVISQGGDLIDVELPHGLEADVQSALVKVIPQYRFHPAMRDGQPIAVRVEIVTNFRIQ